MIKFNELRITPNNETLIIDVSIEDAEYFNNVVLDSIIIDTQDTYIQNGPSTKAVFTYIVAENEHDAVYSIPEEGSCSQVQEEQSGDYCYTIDNFSKKSVRLILTKDDLGMGIANNIFFVYAIASGEPAPDTPCDMKESKRLGVAINAHPIYKQSIAYLKEVEECCDIPKHLTDYIFKIKALDLAIRTGNYLEAIKYWNKFFKPFNYKV